MEAFKTNWIAFSFSLLENILSSILLSSHPENSDSRFIDPLCIIIIHIYASSWGVRKKLWVDAHITFTRPWLRNVPRSLSLSLCYSQSRYDLTYTYIYICMHMPLNLYFKISIFSIKYPICFCIHNLLLHIIILRRNAIVLN